MSAGQESSAATAHRWPAAERATKLHAGAIGDALREAIRTAGRRKLNADEQALFTALVDEFERRCKRHA